MAIISAFPGESGGENKTFFARFSAAADPHTVLLLRGSEFRDEGARGFEVENSNVTLDRENAKFGAASYTFDGSAQLAVPTGTEFGFGLGDFTFEAWVLAQSQTGDHFILNGAKNGDMFVGVQGTSGNVGLGRTGLAWDMLTNQALTQGQWVHLAVVREAGTAAIYLDGQRRASGVNAFGYGWPSRKLYLGSQNGVLYYKGNMQEIRLSDVARYSGLTFAPPDGPFEARIRGDLLGYVAADTPDEYPDGGFASDGYYYELIPYLGGCGGAPFVALIRATFEADATVTCTLGDKVYAAGPGEKEHTFKVFEAGKWVITATLDGESVSQTVEITEDGQYAEVEVVFARIYGIQRDITAQSPGWARTDDAVGLTATASVGTVAGESDFDARMPWSGIRRETLDTGDVMVRIPKFWFRRYREGNVERIQIADKAINGFMVHPVFNHAGVECDEVYVGAYKTSNHNKSAAGVNPQTSKTRGEFRDSAKSKGDGWGIIDISAVSAIQMLVLVEFATNDVQTTIGRGNCDSSYLLQTGSCDAVPNLTGRPAGVNGKTDVVWRGIEGFWGNAWEWVDGINWNAGNYYVCNDPSKYADDTTVYYDALQFGGAVNWSSSYITQEGLSQTDSHVILPEMAKNGSESTYECDMVWSKGGWCVFGRGGYWDSKSGCGLFAALLFYDANHQAIDDSSRLLYIPKGGA